MLPTALPSSLRTRTLAALNPTTTQNRHASVLFALHALSNSRETQHLNKLSRLPRIEHSPPLKLIQSSDVDPFPLPSPPPPKPGLPLLSRKGGRASAAGARAWDAKALGVGRAVLAEHARRTQKLHRSLATALRREARRAAQTAKERAEWQAQARRMRSEMRSAGVAILLAVGAATALATWRFWPSESRGAGARDFGVEGRRIAERAWSAMPFSAARSTREVGRVRGAVPAAATSAVPAAAGPVPVGRVAPAGDTTTAQTRWWQGLFWKQH